MRRDCVRKWCPLRSWEGFVACKWVTVLRGGDQHDKDRIAERAQRELGSRKGKALNGAWGQQLKSEGVRTDGGERGKM